MYHILINGHWLIWLYIIVFFPFQLYDFYKQKKRKIKDYIYVLLTIIVICIYVYGCLYERHKFNMKLLAEDWIYWFLISVIYIQSIYEMINERSKRNCVFFILFTTAILTYIIMSKF